MDYTQTIGNVNELRCMLAFIELGYDCSIPYGNSAKYDFIADINGELLKFQCKSATVVNEEDGTFMIHATCQTTNTKETKKYRYNSSQIDYFITCFRNNIYVIPVDECSDTKTLRLSPPKNGCKTWNKADDYLLDKYFSYGVQYIESKEKYLNRPIPKAKEYFCTKCGKKLSGKYTLCSECTKLSSRKVERPERQVLKQLIRSQSFLAIGKMYEVTDNTIRKWCDYYNLPRRTGDIKKITDSEWDNI